MSRAQGRRIKKTRRNGGASAPAVVQRAVTPTFGPWAHAFGCQCGPCR